MSSTSQFGARLRAVAVAGLLSIPSYHVFAEGETTVPDVVVSATRSEQSGVTIPASIAIITREQIEKSGSRHLADVLRGQGGIQISDPFGDGSRTTVGMRGFGESANANTLILVDGRRLNNMDIGVPDLNSISLKDVRRVEIIQGSAGTLYGDQAVGGIINIITEAPAAFHAFAEAGYGSYESYSARTGVSHLLDNGFSYRMTLEKKESDNYRDNNALSYENIVGRLGYEHDDGSVFFDFQHVDEDLDTPAALLAAEVAANRRQVTADFVNDFSDTETTVLRIGGDHVLNDYWSFQAELTNREVETEFVLSFRDLPDTRLNFQNRHLVTFNPRLIGAYPTGNGDLLFTFGYDQEWADYKIDSVVGVQRNNQDARGLYGQAVIPILPRTTLTLGARRASVRNDLINKCAFPAGCPFFNGIEINDSEVVTEQGLAFRPTVNWRLFVRRDENVRFAKVDEYTNPPPGVILQTQTGESYETGVEWSYAGHSAKALFYRLDLDNEIAFAPGLGAFGFGANINLAQTRRDGVIVEGAWQATDALRLMASYSFIDARVTAGLFEGNRVPYVAENIAKASATYQLTPYWNVFGEVQGVSERVFSGDFDKVLGELPGYGVVNFATDLHYQGWTLSARVNNLLDNEYSDFGARANLFPPPTFAPVVQESFFPSPERNFWLTLRYDYD